MCFRYVFDNFELRDHYGDVGHHLLVQDAASLIQKYIILIDFCSFMHLFTFRTSACFSLISIFCPFQALLVPAMSPPRKISTDSPVFEFSYYSLMPHIYGQMYFLGHENSCFQKFRLKHLRNHTSSHVDENRPGHRQIS
jgi:hypothetical protein